MNPDQGGGINWQQFGNDVGNLFGTGANLYGGFKNAQFGQGLINAGNAGIGMARGAYSVPNFGMTGVGGTGFSVSSPTAKGPGTISSSLGAFNPMYGAYAGAAGNYNDMSQNLARTASSGAQGAYQSALASMMPQLQNMQSNLLAANNNSLFQRGQLGSGSFGQFGNPNNPTNLTTASLGAGFAQQDLQAIMAAQNQGLNFFNSNLQGASALGQLGFGATGAGLGMINAQNSLGSLPLAYSNMTGQQELGATNSLSGMITSMAGRNGLQNGGYGQLATTFGQPGYGGPGGQGGGNNALGSLFGMGKTLYGIGSQLFGGGGDNAGLTQDQLDTINNTDFNTYQIGGGGGDVGVPPPNAAGGEAAAAGGTAGPGGASTSGAGSTLGQIGTGVGGALNAVGIYQGLQRGGFMGDASAAINAASLANKFGAGIPGVGPAAAVLATYNAIKNYQPGKPGADALQGAEAGAAWGSLFGPIGTGVGAVIGGAVGALSGLAGNAGDAEAAQSTRMDAALGKLPASEATQAASMMPPASATTYLQSIMSARDNSPGHSTGLEIAFGRNNVSGFTNQMDSMLSSAFKSGKIQPGTSPQDIYAKVVAPWLKTKGASIDMTNRDHTGQLTGPGMVGAIESLIGQWGQGH